VPAAVVKELRTRTGASMGKCRDALKEEGGDIEKAVEWLRRRGVRSMEKRAGMETGESLLAISLAPAAGAIVELRAETDFVTRNAVFQEFCVLLAQTAARAGATDCASLHGAQLEGGHGQSSLVATVSSGSNVSTALGEVGSVLGERLELGGVHCLAAPPDGVIAGYAHPKYADAATPGTGRMAAFVTMRAVPPGKCDLDHLRGIAAKLARHAVAAQPQFVSVAHIPADVIEKERETHRAAHIHQMSSKQAGRPVDEKVMEKVLNGKMQKFYQDNVFLRQELVAPMAAADGQAEAKPVAVEKWLQAEAKSMELEQITIEDFRVVCP